MIFPGLRSFKSGPQFKTGLRFDQKSKEKKMLQFFQNFRTASFFLCFEFAGDYNFKMPSQVQISMLYDLAFKQSCNEFSIDETLKAYHFVLYDNVKLLECALEIVDGDCIRKITPPSGERCFWRIKGSNNAEYSTFENFCTCRSFYDQSKNCSGLVLCKHILGAMLASSTSKMTTQVVSDDLFVEMLSA